MTVASQRIDTPRGSVRALRADRLKSLTMIFVALLGILALRLVQIQVLRQSHYLWLSKQIERSPQVEPPHRGSILTRDLTPLAESVERLSLCADPMALLGGDGQPNLIPAAADGIAAAGGRQQHKQHRGPGVRMEGEELAQQLHAGTPDT